MYIEDRAYLITLCDKLDISNRRICKDSYGNAYLQGRKGFIDTDSEFWYVRISCRTPTLWKNVKKRLNFMVLWQDGDEEGALRLDRYPTEKESEIIRENVGFSRKPKLTEEERKSRIERLG